LLVSSKKAKEGGNHIIEPSFLTKTRKEEGCLAYKILTCGIFLFLLYKFLDINLSERLLILEIEKAR